MRRRMLSPDFFTDADIIANFDAFGRLFYQGLWCVAEDSGCFEINPLGLKMKIFPGDNIPLEQLQQYIEKLIELNKVVPYEANGRQYGWLKNFHKHQRLDKPSPPSIPLPDFICWHGEEEFGDKRHKYYYEVLPTRQRNAHKQSCPGQVYDKSCPEEKRKEEKRKEVEENISSASDDAGRVNDDRTVTVKKTKEKNGNNSEDVQRVMDEYNRIFAGLWSRPLTLTADRKRKIQARLKSFTVDELITAMKNIRASPFHCGENDRGQVYATPEFIFRNDGQVDKWLKMEVKPSGRSGTDSEGTRKHGKYDDLVLR